MTVIGMDTLRGHPTAAEADEVVAVRAIIEAELAAYQSATDAARVAPTVVALRARAAGIVDTELARLAGRLGAEGVSGRALDEIAHTVRRVVHTLLHAPTVRIKQLAGSPSGRRIRQGATGAVRPRPARRRVGHRGRPGAGGQR